MSGNWNGSIDSPPLPGVSVPSSGADLGGMLAFPPQGKTFIVRGDGTSPAYYSDDPSGFADRLLPSVAKALASCVDSRGDRILVLPGHTESIATADAWPFVAGVKIIGLGSGNQRPIFTWTALAASLLLDSINISITNCILRMEPGAGTVTVAAPMTISAAGCSVVGCLIRMGTTNAQKVGTGISITATDCEFSLNRCYSATAAVLVSMLTLTGADRLRMVYNSFQGATTTTSGVVIFATTASLYLHLEGNSYNQMIAAGAAAVTGLAACSGVSINERFAYLSNSGLTAWYASVGLVAFFGTLVVNAVGETGAVGGTVSA